MRVKIAMIPGDDIGPEILRECRKVLECIAAKYDHDFELVPVTAGASAIERFDDPLPAQELKKCMECDAILLGNIGSRRYSHLPLEKKPVSALFRLRKACKVTTNIRPICLYPELIELSPLKRGIVEKGLDVLVVRDIAAGMIAGEKKNGLSEGIRYASDLEYYDERIIRTNAKWGFEAAMGRKKHVSSMDKANALASSALWRKTISSMACEYPEITVDHHLIDNAAMEVIADPSRFDVIVISNTFGDILADELSELSGCPDLLPSAELSENKRGIYTPNQLHCPNDRLTGRNEANPLGMIAAAALMLRYTANLNEEAQAIETCIREVIRQGVRTKDLCLLHQKAVSCSEMGDRIVEEIKRR